MQKWQPYLLLTPLFILGILFFGGVGNALIQSMGYIPAFDMTDFSFKYYREVLSEPTLLVSVKVSLFIAIVSAIIATILGIIICTALVINGKVRDKALQIVKTPILVPHTIVALFIIMFFSQSGLLARILYSFDLVSGPENFPALLFSSNNIGIIIAYIWKEAPFVAYFVLALMSSINSSLGEAAENLGASGFRSFFHVVLPLSMPAINKAFLIILAYSFGAFELPFLLGATMPRALPVQAYIEYINPDLRHRAYAMALNGIMLFITLIIAAIYYLVTVKTAKYNNGSRHE